MQDDKVFCSEEPKYIVVIVIFNVNEVKTLFFRFRFLSLLYGTFV